METLMIKGNEEIPSVLLDKQNGIFEIAGRSLPENSADFYLPILAWIQEYSKDPNVRTDFMFKLDYFNTSSCKMIQGILSELERIKGTTVIWYFLEDDEIMEETGHEFAEIVPVPFEFKPY
jgi:hypothetical protein